MIQCVNLGGPLHDIPQGMICVQVVGPASPRSPWTLDLLLREPFSEHITLISTRSPVGDVHTEAWLRSTGGGAVPALAWQLEALANADLVVAWLAASPAPMGDLCVLNAALIEDKPLVVVLEPGYPWAQPVLDLLAVYRPGFEIVDALPKAIPQIHEWVAALEGEAL